MQRFGCFAPSFTLLGAPLPSVALDLIGFPALQAQLSRRSTLPKQRFGCFAPSFTLLGPPLPSVVLDLIGFPALQAQLSGRFCKNSIFPYVTSCRTQTQRSFLPSLIN